MSTMYDAAHKTVLNAVCTQAVNISGVRHITRKRNIIRQVTARITHKSYKCPVTD